MTPLLDDRARALLDRERGLLDRLADALDAVALPDDARRARETARALDDEAFLVVVVGEFNAGKSTLLNALFGEKLMEEGPIPTTAKITLLRYGPERFERQLTAYLVERRHPNDLLRHLTLVDTPGTNSIVDEHQRLTEDFAPRADLVLFVTSYDRPLAASERTFLGYLRGSWGKAFACVVNKADLARSPEDLATVVGHVTSGIEDALGIAPEVFAVSAALAYEAKTTASDPVRAALWPQSRFEPFERYVRETLAGPDRLARKLAAPLDAADARLSALDAPIVARTRALDADRARLATLHAHLDATRAALADAADGPLREIEHLLADTEARGMTFLDGAFRATNLGLVRDKDRFRDEFQRNVVRDLDAQIEARVADGVDAMQRRALELWQTAITELRQSVGGSGAGAPGGPGFDRMAAIAALDREADRRLTLHDVREEARRLIENAQGSAQMAQYLGIGAIGIGALGGVLIISSTLDALGGFGVVTAGLLGVASLTFLPAQRARAKDELRTRMEALRTDLLGALTTEFQRQADAIAGRAKETLGPFETGVATEAEAVAHLARERDALSADVALLRRDAADVARSAAPRHDAPTATFSPADVAPSPDGAASTARPPSPEADAYREAPLHVEATVVRPELPPPADMPRLTGGSADADAEPSPGHS